MIKCLIISNLYDDQLRLICLQKELTLDQLLEKAQKREDAKAMNEVMHKNDREKEKMNKVIQRKPFKKNPKLKAEMKDNACDAEIEATKTGGGGSVQPWGKSVISARKRDTLPKCVSKSW